MDFTDTTETEELEHVPWSTLLSEQPDPRRRWGLVAAGLLVAAVLGVMAARTLRSGGEGTVVIPPTTVASAAAPTTVASTDPPALPDAGSPSALLAEADLMAGATDSDPMAAAAIAEAFMSLLYTVDGDPTVAEAIRSLLPSGLDDVPLPQDTSPAVRTYVDWMATHRVERFGPEGYMVHLAVRLVHVDDTGRVRRDPVRGFKIPVGVRDGEGAVMDFPTPTQWQLQSSVTAYADPTGELADLAATLESLLAARNGKVVKALDTGEELWFVVTLERPGGGTEIVSLPTTRSDLAAEAAGLLDEG